MKWSYALLLPLLGGCLAMPSPESALPAAAAFGPDSGRSMAEPLPAQPVDGLFPDQMGASLSLLDEQDLFGIPDEEEVEEALPDPETIEDNVLLSGAGESPPEDEGETVTADTVIYDFPVVQNEKVHYYIDYYTGPARKVFGRWLERSTRYLPMMRQIFAEEGLPQDLAYLAMVESGFNNRAVSWAHAVGPWQFIAGTGRLYGMKSDWWRDERRDFEKATRSAARFLRDLHVRFNGDWYLAVAAYNAGPGKIQRGIDRYDTRDFWELSRHSYLALETKHYVPKLLAVLLIAKQAEKYGFVDLAYQEPLLFDTVTVPTATDLEIVARFCEVGYEEVKDLNPELKRWCTPPEIRNYDLRIPAGKKEQFERQYALLPEKQRANYKHHQVKSGDTLSGIAHRYGIRIEDIVTMNRIRNPRSLRIGTELILPMRKGLSTLPLEDLRKEPAAASSKTAKASTYKVRKGDNLWKIANRYGVSEKDLRAWNRLGNKDIIRVGQVLTVAKKGSTPAKTARKGQEANNRVTYKVQAGDTLWKIANRFGVTTIQLQEWNRLSAKDVLRPGQKLVILAQTAPASAKGKVSQIGAGDPRGQNQG